VGALCPCLALVVVGSLAFFNNIAVQKEEILQ